ncbi:unnamed protein product [Clonostachys rosea]|uniref:Uncharacterized protein n=1 Tax=Bionectria ochroleuca TaxID=29856 RepID=A0ABY6TWQ6_BIOOC|nr:unnamed protein product [Clonostachys rosea]
MGLRQASQIFASSLLRFCIHKDTGSDIIHSCGDIAYVLNTGHLNLDTLALTHLSDDSSDLGTRVKRRATGQNLPVVKHGLREGLAGGGGTEISVEAEGLQDGEVGLDVEERSTRALLLVEDVTTSAGKDTVDTAHGVLGHLNLDQVDGLEQSGLGQKGSGVQDTTSSGDDLATSTVDSISVQGHIKNVETGRAHGLLSNGTLTGSPLETGDNGILDFVEVLDGLGLVNQQVGTSAIRTEGPDLTGVSDIPAEVVSEDTGTGLEIVTGRNLATLDSERELLLNRLGNHVQTVVLVGGLGESSDAGLALDSLTVLDDGVGDDQRDTGVVFLKILQANLEMQLTGTSNDVLTGLRGVGKDARVGLGETLEAFDKLGQILGVLDLDGALHDRGDGELHDLEVVGGVKGGESTRLEQELVDTDETDNVSGGEVVNGVDLTTHHQDGTLNGLDEEIILLTRGVVGTLDADLETGADGTGEDTTEGVETTLIGSGHHLGDVKHEGTLGVTVTDTDGGLVVKRTLVQSLSTVLLGSDGRRKVENHHLQKGVGSGEESAHDNLEQLLALLLAVVGRDLELELVKKSSDLVVLEVHDGGEDLEDGVQDELVESTLKGLALVGASLGPLLGVGVEEVVALQMVPSKYTIIEMRLACTANSGRELFRIQAEKRTYPETLHHLVLVNTKLLGVSDSELANSEGPAVETGTEGNGTLVGVDLDITESLVKVGGDDDVNGLNGTGEGLVKILLGDLELEKSTVDLVDDDNGLDTLTKGLTEHSLGLNAHTFDGVDDDEGTVSDTESSSNLRGEINVTGGVNQVDQEVLTIGLLANDILDIFGVLKMTVQRDSGGLDGNTTLLLIGTSIGGTSLTGLGGGDNTGLGQQGVGQGRLAVVDVGNDGHVSDIGGLVHEGPDLVDRKAIMVKQYVSKLCFFLPEGIVLSPEGQGAVFFALWRQRRCVEDDQAMMEEW